MKRYVLMLAALLAPGLLSSAPVTSDALGTVKYEVSFKGTLINAKVADATITLEHGTWQQQKVLHARAAINAVSIFRLFMNAEYRADSYIVPGTREPVYYKNPILKGGKEGKFECIYDKGAGTISATFAPPSVEPVESSFPYDGKTMDLLSLLQYVRFLDLPEGHSLSMHVLKAGISVPAVLKSLGTDTERFPGQSTDRFLLSMTGKGLMENGSGDKIYVWRSTAPDRKLVGLEVNLGSGVMAVSLKD